MRFRDLKSLGILTLCSTMGMTTFKSNDFVVFKLSRWTLGVISSEKSLERYIMVLTGKSVLSLLIATNNYDDDKDYLINDQKYMTDETLRYE